jgi:Arc-like DNA binding domain
MPDADFVNGVTCGPIKFVVGCPEMSAREGPAMARKATAPVQLKLRFDEKLRRKLEHAALRNDQSMNAEIIHRLEQSFLIPEIAEAAANLASERLVSRLEKGPLAELIGLVRSSPQNPLPQNPLAQLMGLVPSSPQSQSGTANPSKKASEKDKS